MKSITFTVAKGGVGKTVLMANVATALAAKGYTVVMVEGDPSTPLKIIFDVNISERDINLGDVVERNLDLRKAIYKTKVENISLIPSGIHLEDFFRLNPLRFAEKLASLDCDYLFIDAPYPAGAAAFLSLGFCQYFIPIITEDEFTVCLTGAIDTVDIGVHSLKCIPIGYILNRVKAPQRFDEKFVEKISTLLGTQCIAIVRENEEVSKSYGKTKKSEAFLVYQRNPESEFSQRVNDIARIIIEQLPEPFPEKLDPPKFLKEKIEVID